MQFALNAPYPDASEVINMSMLSTYREPESPSKSVREMTLGQAIREALAEELRRDPTRLHHG